jgi:cyanophycinase
MEIALLNARRGPETWAHIPLEEGVGSLVIVGGGGTPPLVHDLFFHLAGGPRARVLHMPSATITFDEIPDKREYYCDFYDRNPESFEFLHTYDRAVAETPEFAEPLNRATGVWIGGGSQYRLWELFGGTEVVAAIHRLVDRGGVVAGTSSGTAIMSDAMICCGYEEPEFGQGFALYPRAIVDPHFTQRERQGRVARAVLMRPDQIAVAIDEKTALVVHGNHLGVVGHPEGSVWFHFANAFAGKVFRYRLRSGETATLPRPARGANPRILKKCLREFRPPEVIRASELVSEPAADVPTSAPLPEPATPAAALAQQ